MTKTILILAANPTNTHRLRLDQEVREIDNGLQRARRRDEFVLKQSWAVRIADFRRAMLDYKPNIVHFSGHGVGEEGIAFEDENGLVKLISADALSGFFELFADNVECVVLNACYSEVQAEAIGKKIPNVIGMNKAIGDAAAIEFAVAFYDALGAGETVQFAYKLACNVVQFEGGEEYLTPILKTMAQDPELTKKVCYKEITKVTYAEPELSVPLSAEIIKANEGGLSIWVYVNRFGQGIRSLETNRYLFAHDTAHGSPKKIGEKNRYINVLSLSRGPEKLNPPSRPQWKFWITNENGESWTMSYPDSIELLVGWHLFTIRWNHERLYLEVLIDKEVILKNANAKETDYRKNWPKRFDNHIRIGTWNSGNQSYWIETFVYRAQIIEKYPDNKWIAGEIKSGPRMDPAG